MDKIFGTVTMDITWLNEYYPKALQDWIVQSERLQAKSRIAFNKKLERVQYFLDNDTDDDVKTLDIKKAMQFAVDSAMNENNPDTRESMWYSIRSLGSSLPNYPHHRIGKEEEE